MMDAFRPGADDGAEPSSATSRFAEYEHVAEVVVDSWARRLRETLESVAVRTREQAEDLWADAQHERARRSD
jgi:phosphohistidine phosphatase SixA